MLRASSSSSPLAHTYSSPNRSTIQPLQNPTRSRTSWLTNFIPVQAVEDHSDVIRDLEQQELEVAMEVTEKSDLDAAAADRAMPMVFNRDIHEEAGDLFVENKSWRLRDRMKTVSVALVVCLNIGVDPPDVTKTQPCARTECWIDPIALNPQRAIEAIGNNLQKQYERWQPKARYRQSLDPPLEEVRRLSTGLRRNARDDRVLFHYNGHGVPKPTTNGEIWVFNRNYTQYIPLSLYDLQAWMGSPSVFVYDCSNAGIIIQAFGQFAEQHEREFLEQAGTQGATPTATGPPVTQAGCIQLGACAVNQSLPMNPELPADLFTCCLTNPIKMALRWFVMQKHGKLSPNITVDMIDKIPGMFGDRRTMLGELNWIFTAVTDTIAWNSLPRDLFQKLFRQDLLVASLFRNFLLADRIMRSYDCTPVSQPSLPSNMHQHNMWKAWDFAVDICLSQLNNILDFGATYKSSSFFEDQLTAFDVWLKFGNEKRGSPEQLPIVLQVLLSQSHRLRALQLLDRFLDNGKWAVNLALGVGIFPYVLKLLQSTATELKLLLVSIWTKVIAIDISCKNDLVRDSNQRYFVAVLQDESMSVKYKTWAVFILATVCYEFPAAQKDAEQSNLISICLEHLDIPDPLLRQWMAIAIGRVWDKYEKARWKGARDNAHEKLYELLSDPVPEVRASAVYALGTFLNSCENRTEHANTLDHAVALHLVNNVMDDASPMVRKELILALYHVVTIFESNFVTACRLSLDEFKPSNSSKPFQEISGLKPIAGSSSNLINLTSKGQMNPSVSTSALDRIGINKSNSATGLANAFPSVPISGFYGRIFKEIKTLARDPDPDVARMAEEIYLYLFVKAKEKKRNLNMSSSRICSPGHSVADTASTASVPSSPAKASFLIGTSPPSNTSGLRPLTTPVIPPPIAEETSVAAASPNHTNKKLESQNYQTSPNSSQSAKDLKPPEPQTNFYHIFVKNFTKKLMKHECTHCDCDPESSRHWNKEWLYSRNLEVRAEAEYQREWLKARWCKLDNVINSFKSPFSPSLMVFHPYNQQIAIAGNNQIMVQNLDTSSELCSMKLNFDTLHETLLATPIRAQFTALTYINAHDEALLLAGTNDGCLRVYKDKEDAEDDLDVDSRVRLVTAWNGLAELMPITAKRKNRNLRLAWDQKSCVVALGGDVGVIRLWDAKKELKMLDLSTTQNYQTYVNCLSFSPQNSYLLASGFGDGSASLFDIRTKNGSVLDYQEHEHPHAILDCKLQDSGGFTGHLVIGSSDGEMRIIDPRKPSSSVREISLGQSLTTLHIHQRAFAAAAWTTSQYISIHSLLGNGNPLNSIRAGEGLLGHRKGLAKCLSFHPHLLQLAVAPTDGVVNVYNLRRTT